MKIQVGIIIAIATLFAIVPVELSAKKRSRNKQPSCAKALMKLGIGIERSQMLSTQFSDYARAVSKRGFGDKRKYNSRWVIDLRLAMAAGYELKDGQRFVDQSSERYARVINKLSKGMSSQVLERFLRKMLENSPLDSMPHVLSFLNGMKYTGIRLSLEEGKKMLSKFHGK